MELQNERRARIAAEIQARKLELISKEECAKVHELEDVKKKLEVLLDQEKAALRDEEIGKKSHIFEFFPIFHSICVKKLLFVNKTILY